MQDNNFYFGGGVQTSSMTAVVAAITVLAAILLLALPRKRALAPFMAAVFLTPFGQVITVGGAHFGVSRLLAAIGALRIIGAMLMSRDPVLSNGVNRLDKLFCVWAVVRGLAFILLFRETGAFINQAGLWLDAFGLYFLFRYLIRDQDDVFRAIKLCAGVVSVLAACMLFEFVTRINPFSYMAGHTIQPWLRNGWVRAQAVFGNSITAGCFGATLAPLFYWPWKSGKSRFWGLAGFLSSGVVAVTSVASSPMLGFLAGMFALFLWPARKLMKIARWGLVFAIAMLALVMKAPVWYIITRINIAGGQSWDRAYLIDQAMRHILDWWLIGTKDNASWGYFTWDQCNQYINEGLQGGLATMLLFLAIITVCFSVIGRCRKQAEGTDEEWFFWCFGAALFAHVIVFLGVDYFDQTRVLWFFFLAMVSAATFPVLAASTVPAADTSGPLPSRLRVPQPSGASLRSSVSSAATDRMSLSQDRSQSSRVTRFGLPRTTRPVKE